MRRVLSIIFQVQLNPSTCQNFGRIARPARLDTGARLFSSQASCPLYVMHSLHLTCGRSILRSTAACIAHHPFLPCRCYSYRLSGRLNSAPVLSHLPGDWLASSQPHRHEHSLPFTRRALSIAYDTHGRTVMLSYNSSS